MKISFQRNPINPDRQLVSGKVLLRSRRVFAAVINTFHSVACFLFYFNQGNSSRSS
jgi:hypothetical protein